MEPVLSTSCRNLAFVVRKGMNPLFLASFHTHTHTYARTHTHIHMHTRWRMHSQIENAHTHVKDTCGSSNESPTKITTTTIMMTTTMMMITETTTTSCIGFNSNQEHLIRFWHIICTSRCNELMFTDEIFTCDTYKFGNVYPKIWCLFCTLPKWRAYFYSMKAIKTVYTSAFKTK